MKLTREDGTKVSEEVQRYARGALRLPICLDHSQQLEDVGLPDYLLATGVIPQTEDGTDLQCRLLSLTAWDQQSWAAFYEGIGFVYVLLPTSTSDGEVKILLCPVPGPGDDARRLVLSSATNQMLDRIGVKDRRISSAGARGQA